MTETAADGSESKSSQASFSFLGGVTRLLTSALRNRLAGNVSDYLDLFNEDAVVEIPYGPTSEGERAEGKTAIAAYMSELRGTVMLEEMTLDASHGAGDTVVLEYRGIVHALRNDIRFEQRYIAIVTVREGRIALLREYSNPLLAQPAFAGRM